MIKINGTILLSNGLDVNLEEGMHAGQYADGTKYIVSGYKIIFITERISVFNEPDDEAMLALYEAGWFDLWFLKNFNGKDYRFARPELHARIEEKKQREERKKKVQELESKYPEVPDELKERIRNLDHYHEYGDDGKVWRNAQDRHDKVIEELNAIGKLDLYKEYRKLIFTK